jgi:hypothetical protein
MVELLSWIGVIQIHDEVQKLMLVHLSLIGHWASRALVFLKYEFVVKIDGNLKVRGEVELLPSIVIGPDLTH